MLRQLLNDRALYPIFDKIQCGTRLSFEDGLVLLRSPDVAGVGALADYSRKNRAGDNVYFINNYHLYCTNVCVWECKFCAFSRPLNSPEGFSKSLSDVAAELESLSPQPSEIRITGGVNPNLGLGYYVEILHWIKENMPGVHVEALAPTEVAYIAGREKMSVGQVLETLRNAGLSSLTAGGAEVFNPELRRKLCPRKTSAEKWAEIVKIAHGMGIPSNASILYGHIETSEDRVGHLLTLREIQDETQGFNSFIPLCFLPANTALSHIEPLSDDEVLRMAAVSRLLLDNFKYIKFLWLYHGLDMAAKALDFGVNDLGGCVNEKHKGVARSAGSSSAPGAAAADFLALIRDKGRNPVERGRLYEEKHPSAAVL